MNPELRATLFTAFAFALGAVVGSFLNVVIYRLPRGDEGLTVSHPRRSLCPRCGATIRWYDNIPLISYFVLLGKCRACRAPISLRYFCVELLTASLFAYLGSRFLAPSPAALDDVALFTVYSVIVAALIAITFIDIDLMIIPDAIDVPGIVLAPLAAFAVPALHLGWGGVRPDDLETLGLAPALIDPLTSPRLYAVAASAIGIIVGGGVIWAIGWLGTLAFKKEAMGFGDVKLLAMIGGYIGWKGTLIALFLGCLSGAAIGVVVKLLTKDSYIPFGPFLALGALIVILWRPEVTEFLFVTYPRIVRLGCAAGV